MLGTLFMKLSRRSVPVSLIIGVSPCIYSFFGKRKEITQDQ